MKSIRDGPDFTKCHFKWKGGENVEVLYTVAETTKILKTNIEYVHKLRKAGLLPFLKLGCYKVRKEALDEFLAKYEGMDLTNPFEIKKLETEELCQN